MCDNCDWERQLSRIEEMLDLQEFQKSHYILNEVYDWITRHEHSTPAQIDLLDSIERRVRY